MSSLFKFFLASFLTIFITACGGGDDGGGNYEVAGPEKPALALVLIDVETSVISPTQDKLWRSITSWEVRTSSNDIHSFYSVPLEVTNVPLGLNKLVVTGENRNGIIIAKGITETYVNQGNNYDTVSMEIINTIPTYIDLNQNVDKLEIISYDDYARFVYGDNLFYEGNGITIDIPTSFSGDILTVKASTVEGRIMEWTVPSNSWNDIIYTGELSLDGLIFDSFENSNFCNTSFNGSDNFYNSNFKADCDYPLQNIELEINILHADGNTLVVYNHNSGNSTIHLAETVNFDELNIDKENIYSMEARLRSIVTTSGSANFNSAKKTLYPN